MLLAKKNKKDPNVDHWYCERYSQWKKNMSKNQTSTSFFMLYKNFEKHLKDISSGALKLYLYYGFYAKNETGVLWHSIETVCNYFQVSEKTVNNWNRELIERGLIYRVNKDNKRNKTTYLLPLSLTLYEEQEIDMNYLNNDKFKEVFGDITAIFHLFQWRQNKIDPNKYDDPCHIAIIILNNKEQNQYTAIKLAISEDEYDITKRIDEKVTADEVIARFDSDLDLDINFDEDIQGIAVNSRYNLNNKKVLYDLINELIDEETDIQHYKKVNLISGGKEDE